VLVLSRRLDERLILTDPALGPDPITIRVVDLRADKVRLGVEAPGTCRVDREEVHRLRLAAGGGSAGKGALA